ncbi:hypothetical protein CH25_gp30 [Mycobacterium phage EagleEye]|uniref:Gp68-like predicted RNA polymerase component domain-containing protein n=1 Tax=Mycobacterium phage EagleEye TaxID=1429759 RepID=W0LJ91_9CAUD|nr:hypothetical protein CH25_gp30 [Mycobacterium phage EagleEye]AHG23856.1 hypothetical protein PBI_EAGLEEYE_76 [Mycobacterium phage EagleEye]QDK03509.1 helix-turn-helix DNA-binding domain protein [Mycobacterium phage Lucyedi]
MTKLADFSPENPRDWDPNHPSLRSPIAPHETGGLLRIRRSGATAKDMLKLFKIGPQALANSFNKAMANENDAAHAGRDIYDGTRAA